MPQFLRQEVGRAEATLGRGHISGEDHVRLLLEGDNQRLVDLPLGDGHRIINGGDGGDGGLQSGDGVIRGRHGEALSRDPHGVRGEGRCRGNGGDGRFGGPERIRELLKHHGEGGRHVV